MAKENGRKGRISRGGVRTGRGRPGADGHTEGARKKDHPEECGDGPTIHTTTLTGRRAPGDSIFFYYIRNENGGAGCDPQPGAVNYQPCPAFAAWLRAARPKRRITAAFRAAMLDG
jgi:hypothetical protein